MIGIGAAIGNAVGGLISGVGNLIGTSMSNKQSEENIHLNASYQEQLAQAEWERNLQMWHLQNQYNSPASQMARFSAAGLNPHLIYGQGNAGNASGIAQYQRPSADLRFSPASLKFGEMFSQVSNAITTLLNFKRLDADIRQIDSITRFNDSRINEINQNIVNKQMDYLYKRLGYNQKQSLFPYQLSMLRQQITNAEKDAEIKDYTRWQKHNEVSRFNKYGVLPSDPPLFKLINLIGRDLGIGLSNPFSGYEGPDKKYPALSNNAIRKFFYNLFN